MTAHCQQQCPSYTPCDKCMAHRSHQICLRSESEDSIDIELNSESSVQLRLCFLFSSHSHFSSRFDVLLTVIYSVLVQALPTEQATPALTDSFSQGHDPFAHACKARPLTIVGRPFLSVSLTLSLSLSLSLSWSWLLSLYTIMTKEFRRSLM